jgi:hypothetical protein
MKLNLLHILTLGLLFTGSPLAVAQDDTNSPSATDYNSFKLISDRNIFNPNRRGGQRDIVRTPSVKVDSFKLVGTMNYEKGKFAFFDGTSSEYRKTLKLSDIIGGYRIADISPNAIKLLAAGNSTVSLPVGAQMRRQDGGPWALVSKAEPVPGGNTVPTDNADIAAKAATLNGAESDALKRLLLRRMKEQ